MELLKDGVAICTVPFTCVGKWAGHIARIKGTTQGSLISDVTMYRLDDRGSITGRARCLVITSRTSSVSLSLVSAGYRGILAPGQSIRVVELATELSVVSRFVGCSAYQ
jgi:hypothetical protein